LPANRATFAWELNLDPDFQTWTDSRGTAAEESRAINCVTWYEAFAFCIWDGGRLPTEAEWEYAAAGGSENRLYPWGSAAPTMSLAVYECHGYPGGACATILPVGSTPAGDGRWGHADMAGNAAEWTLDWYAPYPTSASTDYANTSLGSYRVKRGGNFAYTAALLRSAERDSSVPDFQSVIVGLRCARRAQ
jgi:formylglycine-generating enzyme required for sulfatase activity